LADALEKGNPSPSPPPASTRSTDAAPLQDAASPTGAQTDRVSAPGAQSGEGIGLSIVKRLCDMLDATIELKSEPSVGTSFRILFPRHYTA
jgi:hypothetical protein